MSAKILQATTFAFDLSFARLVSRSELGEESRDESEVSSSLRNRSLLEARLASRDSDVVLTALRLIRLFNFRESHSKVQEVVLRIDLGLAPRLEALRVLAGWKVVAATSQLDELLDRPLTLVTVADAKALILIDRRTGVDAVKRRIQTARLTSSAGDRRILKELGSLVSQERPKMGQSSASHQFQTSNVSAGLATFFRSSIGLLSPPNRQLMNQTIMSARNFTKAVSPR